MYRIRFKSIRFGLISFFVLLIQSTLVNSIAIGSVKPNLVLLMVIFFALYNGSKPAMYYGIIIGLFFDALSGGIVGVNSFVFGCLGVVCGFLKERVYANHFLTKFLVGLSACLFYVIVYYVLALHFFKLPEFFANLDIVIGMILYTSICNIFFADILDRLVIIRSTSLL